MFSSALFLGFCFFAQDSLAANHYVRKGATGSNNGSNWTDAWNELNQINWTVVNPGDTVLVGQGTYTTRLTMSKAGAGGARITVQKATDAGYNGQVTIPGVTVTAPYNTLDGVNRNSFTITATTGGLVDINTGVPTDIFELKHAYVLGYPSAVYIGGRMFNSRSGGFFIDGCEFYNIHGSEDQLIMTSPGSGSETIRIENSIFRHWASLYIEGASWSPPWTHSDLFQDYCGTSDCYRGDFTFKYNLVDGSGVDTDTESYFHDVFMNAYTHYDDVDVEYNVFKDGSDVIKIKSADSVRITNNVFAGPTVNPYACYTTCSPLTIVNNIYYNVRGTYGVSVSQNSIWSGSSGYVSGNGNLQADPLFVNPNLILGADAAGFTADDGFNILSGSPAINAGAVFGQTRDIRNNPISGLPDIGAYEYGAGGASDTTAPVVPTGLTVN